MVFSVQIIAIIIVVLVSIVVEVGGVRTMHVEWKSRGEMDDPEDQVTSILGCWSFVFRFANTLELHRT